MLDRFDFLLICNLLEICCGILFDLYVDDDTKSTVNNQYLIGFDIISHSKI